jgi:Ca2+/H+ antiporter
MNKISYISIISNILLVVGLSFLLYKIVVADQQKNKKMEETYNTVQQLAAQIIVYNSEPQTVKVLASEIIRYTNIEEVKKEDNALYVRR